ncbi:hypothetical protein J5751_07765 [bacterium]|nr:hypothetical protein [bacterium]
MVDLLLLENSELKHLLKQLDPVDSNLLSITYPGYKFYKLLFDKLEKANLSDNEKYIELLKVNNKYN